MFDKEQNPAFMCNVVLIRHSRLFSISITGTIFLLSLVPLWIATNFYNSDDSLLKQTPELNLVILYSISALLKVLKSTIKGYVYKHQSYYAVPCFCFLFPHRDVSICQVSGKVSSRLATF